VLIADGFVAGCCQKEKIIVDNYFSQSNMEAGVIATRGSVPGSLSEELQQRLTEQKGE